MKTAIFLITFLSLFKPSVSYALMCSFTEFTQEVYDEFDLIAKGTITEPWSNAYNPLKFRGTPFYLNVEKAWKGASPGDKIKIIYEHYDTTGLRKDISEIIYAYKNEDGYLATGRCIGAFKFPKPKELEEFLSNRPFVDENDHKKREYVKKMQVLADRLEEDTLDEYSR